MRRLETTLVVAALATTLSAGCTEQGRALIPVDVSYDSAIDQNELQTVQVVVLDGHDVVIANQTTDYVAGVEPLKLGVYADVEETQLVSVQVAAHDGHGDMKGFAQADSVEVSPGQLAGVVAVTLQPRDAPGMNMDGGVPPMDGSMMTDPDGGVKLDAKKDVGVDAPVINPNAKWSAPKNHENNLAAWSYWPRVASNRATGDAVVVWAESRAVKAVHYDADNDTWSAIKTIQNINGADEPVVGIDGEGNAIAAWVLNPDEPPDPTDEGVWAAKAGPDGTWSPPVQVHQGKSWGGTAIAVSEVGSARLAWTITGDHPNLNRRVTWLWSTNFNGTTWGNPREVMDSEFQEDLVPMVAINGQNEGVIAWTQPVSGGSIFEESIWAVTYDGAILGTPRVMEDNTDRNWYPTVALNDAGRGIVMYMTNTAADAKLIGHIFDGANFGEADTVDIAYSITPPSVVVDAENTIHVVYGRTERTVGKNVHYTSWDDGAWGTPVPVETMNLAETMTDEHPMPVLKQDAAGNLVTVWRRRESPDEDYTWSVMAARKPVGEAWGMPEKLAGIDMLKVSEPAFDMGKNGVGVAAWTHWTNGNAMPAPDTPRGQVHTAVLR